MQRVTSRDNPRLVDAARLLASSRERRRSDRCVLEGEHLVAAFMARHGPPDFAIVHEAALDRPGVGALGRELPDSRLLVVDDELWTALPQVPQGIGIVAVGRAPRPVLGAPSDFIVLLDALQDPGNVGTILRSAAAAGVRQVLLSNACAFAWAPKVMRAAQGAHFHLDIHEGVDLATWARAYGGNLVAAVASGGEPVFAADLARPLALAIGNEGAGLAPDLLAEARRRVTIPMPGGFESLNAAAAATVCLFEIVRRGR